VNYLGGLGKREEHLFPALAYKCKKMDKIVQILSLITGIIFLISGIGKSLETYMFAEKIALYGSAWFSFLAPFVILLEMVLGLFLFFYFQLKQTSLAALCFVTGISVVYLYGYLFINITDCGCFGYFSLLDMPPILVFIRNFILMGLLFFVFLHSNNTHKVIDKKEAVIMLCILCVVSFVTGYTYVEHRNEPNGATLYITNGKYVNKNIRYSRLDEFVKTSIDSTYLIFAFSYSCPHCYNSIENLKQYERLGVVDKVVALSFITDDTIGERFDSLFNPNFQIKKHPPQQLFQLTTRFPTSYYIKNDTVQLEIHGVLPSGYVLLQQLSTIH
jgi:uncharacterized membrane protein YphA (DoxX/SURF4 family)